MLRNTTTEDIQYVVEHMRAADRAEIEAVTGLPVAEAVATIDKAPYIAITVYKDEPVAVFGAMLTDPKTATMFRFATDAWPTAVREAIKFGRRAFLAKMWQMGVERIEAVTLDVPEQTAWLKLFGASEVGKFGRNGQNFVQFAVDRPA